MLPSRETSVAAAGSCVVVLAVLVHCEPARLLGVVHVSATLHTTLGCGEGVPVGNLRFLFGMEALTGLFRVAWSASPGFLETRRHRREDHVPGGADGISGRDEGVAKRGAAGDGGRRP